VRVYERASWVEIALVRHDAEATVAAFSPTGGSCQVVGIIARFWDWRRNT
jgi:hypothetical protein